MFVLIINFQLKGITPEQFEAACDEMAPAFAAVPGLLSKVWLADHESGTFGGVYLWSDEESLRAFQQSELMSALLNHPNIENITSREFGMLEGPTRMTRGVHTASV